MGERLRRVFGLQHTALADVRGWCSCCPPRAENIAFAALTRLPNSWDVDRKLAFADSVIDILGLDEIRDSLIGDENVRGISGEWLGRRKQWAWRALECGGNDWFSRPPNLQVANASA